MRKTLAVLALGIGMGSPMCGAATADSLVAGDAEAGKAKAITCGACHGADGNSVNPQWPSIAGQHAPYIVASLHAFKSGTRNDPLMTSQAMLLSDQDILDLAAYFESQTPAAKAVADVSTIDKGAALYRGGVKDTGAAACMSCHGPAGHGNPAARYPMLGGQYATYAAAQLRKYASGERQSDGTTKVMRDIAARLTEDDIEAVASYMQGLH